MYVILFSCCFLADILSNWPADTINRCYLPENSAHTTVVFLFEIVGPTVAATLYRGKTEKMNRFQTRIRKRVEDSNF